jgi:hypothetical protein
MANKIKTLLKGSENQWEFKELLWNELENVPGSEKVKKTYKKELFKEIVADEDYQKLPRTKTEKKEVKIESKEKLEKSLEFEEDTFKIDSRWWKLVTKNDKYDDVFGKFYSPKLRVKVNNTWDVVEYIDWPAKWEQLFIWYNAFIREVCKVKNCTQEEAEKKYLMTLDEFKQKMVDKPDDSEEYKKFFNEEVKW